MEQAALHLIVGHRQAFTSRSDLICYAHAYHTIIISLHHYRSLSYDCIGTVHRGNGHPVCPVQFCQEDLRVASPRKRLNYNVGFCIKQPLRKATDFASKFTRALYCHYQVFYFMPALII